MAWFAAEWSVHHSIVEIRDHEGDAEAKFVVANPPDVRTFLRVQELLQGLQHDLDTSWAVLGEVYSRQGNLKNLGIRLRRVHSNLDDLRGFRGSVGYVPDHFAFETAGVELLKKLVGPLYGDRPEVGIRELLQNAVDAVNERDLLNPTPGGGSGSKGGREPEVTVRVERIRDGECWVTVQDRGIGMTDAVLRSYFFRVGASFRESDSWRRTFAPGGIPKVVRSGRFGIGVLAAFLLGDRIDVLTRHVEARPDEALAFSASIDDEIIEVKRASRPEPGTTVRVQVSESVSAKLREDGGKDWHWYRWDIPRIERYIDENGDLPRLTRLPGPGADLPEEWHRLETTDFDDMIWTFGRAPRIVCNGLNIGSSASSTGLSREFHWDEDPTRHDVTLPIKVPCISVCDRQGRFPVDLQRFDIVGHRYPFDDDLLADVTRDYCAFCLVYAPRIPPTRPVSIHRGSFTDYPGLADEFRWV